MMSVTKVYIVDDHQMLIDGLKALLIGEPTISIIGESNSSTQALKQILNLRPPLC
jgi:two-component system response regulator DevR